MRAYFTSLARRIESPPPSVVGDQAVETLVTYRYDENGQLSQVANRNGDTVRRFTYTDGVMTRHSNALGLACEYRWETIDGQPRVVEHWTSDGERHHYVYDFKAGISQITDVLDRTAEFHFNKDHRVTASRDFGGEHYRFGLDAHGNMTGIELPDGRKGRDLMFENFRRVNINQI